MNIRLLMARPSFKSFMAEFLMIMLGVLAALALEQVAQSILHARAANATKVMLDAEIHTNLKTIRRIRQLHAQRVQSMAFMADLLLRDIRAGVPDAKIIEHFSQARAQGNYFGMNINTPLLQHTDWDIAVADQSAGWMEPDTLRPYAWVYATYKMLPEHLRGKTAQLIHGPEMVDIESNLALGEVDPRALYRATRQVIAVFEMMESNLRTAEEQTIKAFPALVK
jgi:hypothetical protein